MQKRAMRFASDGETLAGELVLPDGVGPHPALLLMGGTISDTRDGDPLLSLRGKMPTHGMLRVMAEHLAGAGLATLRWDKRGVGESSGGDRDLHSDVWTDVADAERAYAALCAADGIAAGRVAILGESAGGHFACLMARRGIQPAAYVMQAALYTSIARMLEFNYQRVADYAARGPEAEAWIRQVAPGALRFGKVWRAMVESALRGEDEFRVADGAAPLGGRLRRLRQEMEEEPANQFRYLDKPVLVIQGDRDLNVPAGDCYEIAKTVRAAGNANVTLVVVPRADHSMQLAPDDMETRIRERISMGSFQNPYSQFFLHALSGWLLDTL